MLFAKPLVIQTSVVTVVDQIIYGAQDLDTGAEMQDGPVSALAAVALDHFDGFFW